MDKDLSGKLSIKITIFIWLLLTGLVAHVFIDNVHQVGSWGIARQLSESGKIHTFADFFEHEDDCMPFALASIDAVKSQTQELGISQIPVISISISPLLPPPKAS